MTAYYKKWYSKNKKRLQEKQRLYYFKNKDVITKKRSLSAKETYQKYKKYWAERYLKNKKTIKTYNKKYYLKNQESIKNNVKKYNKANPEQARIRRNSWFKNNPEKTKKMKLDYRKNNRGVIRERCRRYQASKIKRTPKWLSKEQIKQMQQIYNKCPKGYSVDHIIPLRGKNVSGLHVPWNLQYLTITENSRKANHI